MGTFQSSHPMVPESNRGASTPRFSWFAASFLSSPRHGLNPFQATQIDDKPGVSAIPLRSLSPADETPKSNKKPKTSKTTSEFKHKQKKSPVKSSKTKTSSTMHLKKEKKNPNFSFYNMSLDLSGIPGPVCTCTGVTRQCYRWGAGGWQSSCCTINISEYPLPMSSTRPGSRIAGRKMSHGAYEKLVQRLAGEGYDLTRAVDLKEHWARHGTNKFVTIK